MSERRRARGSGVVPTTGGSLETLLADAKNPLWSDNDAYLTFMAQHEWVPPSRDRLGVTAGPQNRRRAAVAAHHRYI